MLILANYCSVALILITNPLWIFLFSLSQHYCFYLIQEHTGRVFRLQFDEFQIVSSSHDDTILIWDFLNYTPPERVNEARRSPSRK